MAKKKTTKAAPKASKMKPLQTFTPDTIHVRRWTDDTATSADYFYDEPVKDVNREWSRSFTHTGELIDAEDETDGAGLGGDGKKCRANTESDSALIFNKGLSPAQIHRP